MTTSEFLNSATIGGQQSINDIIAAKSDLTRFQDDLVRQTQIDARADHRGRT